MPQKDTPPCPELVVIGAGLSRTGTNSLCTAFETLGLRCHHMFEVLRSTPENAKEWTKIMHDLLEDREIPPQKLGKVLSGYKAAVDAPSNELFMELVRENPGLKVVLTTRERQSWYDSYTGTVGKIGASRVIWPMLVFWLPVFYEQWRLDRAKHRLWVKKYGSIKPEIMDLRMHEVRETVSPARLLEYRIQDGWEPLCTFVGLPVPDVPFPNSNDSAMMQGLMQKVALRGLFRWAVVATATAALVLGFRSFLI